MPFQRYPGAPVSQKTMRSSAAASRRATNPRSSCNSAAVTAGLGGGESRSWLPEVRTQVFQRPARGSTCLLPPCPPVGGGGASVREAAQPSNKPQVTKAMADVPLANVITTPLCCRCGTIARWKPWVSDCPPFASGGDLGAERRERDRGTLLPR